jgi:anti-sigma regulatory factor (Ser/Thr protein kinase)
MQQRTNPPTAGSTSHDQEAELAGIAARRAGYRPLVTDGVPQRTQADLQQLRPAGQTNAAVAVTALTGSRLVVSFGINPSSTVTEVHAEDARHVSAMRRLVRSFVAHCGLPDLMDDAALVVSELITNSLAHSGGADVRMGLRLVGGRLCIEVDDGAADRSQKRLPPPGLDAENGRGLHIVDTIVRSRHGTWGVSPDGARTWCSLPAADEVKQP